MYIFKKMFIYVTLEGQFDSMKQMEQDLYLTS